ncbi:MAG: DUF438 domain-containing protein [Fibrobacter sp.]|nr:DUF438 domain-containing protein [Fibrobacter sp.]
MSELLNNSHRRKEVLMKLLMRLHEGESPDTLRTELAETLKGIPYAEVLQVEQEMISLGMPAEEVTQLCDAHSSVLSGLVDVGDAKAAPAGHPVDVFQQENKAILMTISQVRQELNTAIQSSGEDFKKSVIALRTHFNHLSDVDKHYKRKEFLVFPVLERQGLTAPPEVMWGKHDLIREQIKGIHEILLNPELTAEELQPVVDLVIEPALYALAEMVTKEEEILFPMCMDSFSENDWAQVHEHTLEYGFCIVDPVGNWKPTHTAETTAAKVESEVQSGHFQLPSGRLSAAEVQAIFNSVPFDMTFVDNEDKVKYFTQGTERIFSRNRAILGRNVLHCHPPASSNIVERILEDFRSGREERAAFWINMRGKMIHIEYFALRDEEQNYLGCLEVSQNVTRYRELEGEQRILSYGEKKSD